MGGWNSISNRVTPKSKDIENGRFMLLSVVFHAHEFKATDRSARTSMIIWVGTSVLVQTRGVMILWSVG